MDQRQMGAHANLSRRGIAFQVVPSKELEIHDLPSALLRVGFQVARFAYDDQPGTKWIAMHRGGVNTPPQFSLRHYVHSTFNQEYSERLGARS